MIKKDGFQTAAEERQRQSKEFRTGRLGKAFQKDGPTTAKLLRWAVDLTLGTTRSPCSAERRDLRPGKDDTRTQSSLLINRGLVCKTVAHEHQDLKGNTPVHRQPVQFRTDELSELKEAQ